MRSMDGGHNVGGWKVASPCLLGHQPQCLVGSHQPDRPNLKHWEMLPHPHCLLISRVRLLVGISPFQIHGGGLCELASNSGLVRATRIINSPPHISCFGNAASKESRRACEPCSANRPNLTPCWKLHRILYTLGGRGR